MTERGQQDVFVAMMNLLWPRSGLDRQMFYDYWSGAHTQISSRLPGIHQYFQHHLDPVAGLRFPGAAELSGGQPHPGFYGDAEITFAREADLRDFAAGLKPLMDDEQNVFDKTISYQALGRNVHTLTDRTADDSPNGDLGTAEKYLLYYRRASDLDVDAFRGAIVERVGAALANDPDVSKVRIRLVEPYDNDAVTLLAPNVSNHEDPRTQIHACVEVVFEDAMARRRFASSEASRTVVDTSRDVAEAVFVTRALRTFTVYNHGRITTAGLRTPQMAAQIAAIGATNQLGPDVEALILGPHAHRERAIGPARPTP